MEALEKLILIAVGLLILASFLYWAVPYLFKLNDYKEKINQSDGENNQSSNFLVEENKIFNRFLFSNKNSEKGELISIEFPFLKNNFQYVDNNPDFYSVSRMYEIFRNYRQI